MPSEDLDAFFNGRVAEAVEVEEAGGASALLLCLLLLFLGGGIAVGIGPVVVVRDGTGGPALGVEVEAAFWDG